MKKFLLCCFALFLLAGCLTYEGKIFNYQLNKDGTVDLTVTYVGIRSPDPDSLESAYKELVDSYLNGDELAAKFPYGKIESKRLFEKEGKLYGEVKVKFQTYADAGIYYNKSKKIVVMGTEPFQLTMDETIEKSNGIKPGTVTGLLVWEEDQRNLIIELTSTGGNSGESLLETWKKNK